MFDFNGRTARRGPMRRTGPCPGRVDAEHVDRAARAAGQPGERTLAAGATTLSGNSIDILVLGALLPSTGFAIAQYGVNLWPRSGLANNNQTADFAPNDSDFGVTVPEPVSAALLGSGLLVLAVRRRVSRSPASGSAAG